MTLVPENCDTCKWFAGQLGDFDRLMPEKDMPPDKRTTLLMERSHTQRFHYSIKKEGPL